MIKNVLPFILLVIPASAVFAARRANEAGSCSVFCPHANCDCCNFPSGPVLKPKPGFTLMDGFIIVNGHMVPSPSIGCTCENNVVHCLDMPSNQLCTKCKTGFVPTADGCCTCKKNLESCLSLDPSGKCITCEAGTSNEGGCCKCRWQVEHCVGLTIQGFCYLCEIGYRLSPAGCCVQVAGTPVLTGSQGVGITGTAPGG